MANLKQTPRELDGLYNNILSTLTEAQRNETYQLFKWILCSTRRLSPLELCFAMQGTQTERYIRSRSRGLFEIRHVVESRGDSDTASIQFIHHTVPEFLSRRGLQILRPTDNKEDLAALCHYEMAASCMQYLSGIDVSSSASNTLLRFSARTYERFLGSQTGVPGPQAVRARKDMLASYSSKTEELFIKFEAPSPERLPEPFQVAKLVYSDLPLLEYSILSLQSHLSSAESLRPLQSHIWEIVRRNRGRVFLLWYQLQDAFYLARNHVFHTIDWHPDIQVAVAFSLGSWVRELKMRIHDGRAVSPPVTIASQTLNLAVKQGFVEMARDLIACGADPNGRETHTNYRPLENACIMRNCQMVKMLIECGSNVNTQNTFGYTPLHHVASVDDEHLTRALLDAGAAIDVHTMISRQTPLHVAIERDHASVVSVLLAHGAAVASRDSQGRTATEVARQHRSAAAHAQLNPQDPELPAIRIFPFLRPYSPISRAETASPSPEKQASRKRERSGRLINDRGGSDSSRSDKIMIGRSIVGIDRIV
ncbi:hypothetical protein F5Y16DRAFT_416034 [Xylariaceae sp. FL0255]|nr:hypothetical protein F5Y16DRAFT_416034 [Xylariaceae sp. FL0255]